MVINWSDGADYEVAGRLLPVLSWGDVAHSSVDGDGSSVEAPHHLAHLLPVTEGVIPPHQGSILLLEDNTEGISMNTQ